MSTNTIDKSIVIVLKSPNVEKIKQARRWIRGAVELLVEASNGDEFIDRIAAKAAMLVNMAEVAIFANDDVTK